MTDLFSGRVGLDEFRGLAACGGFSYGDVLGAGEGWAKSILYNDAVRDRFEAFFRREDVFVFGVCNGCQMLAALKSLIPGVDHWPRFVRNRSRPVRSPPVPGQHRIESVGHADRHGGFAHAHRDVPR